VLVCPKKAGNPVMRYIPNTAERSSADLLRTSSGRHYTKVAEERHKSLSGQIPRTYAVRAKNSPMLKPAISQKKKPKLRILVIRYVIIGQEFYAESELRQLAALARRGHEVTVLMPTSPGAQMTLPSVCSFKLETVLLRKNTPVLSLIFFELRTVWKALRSAGRYDCLIFDSLSILAFFPYLLFRRLWSRYPVLLLRVATNPVETGGRLRSLALLFIYTLSIRCAGILFDKIFFITPMLGRLYSNQLHLSESRIAVWPSSVDLGCFYPKSMAEVERLRAELGLTDRLGVLYHGALSRARGIRETVEAFKMLKEEGVKATLVLLGYGPLREELRTLVRSNLLEDVVKIPEAAATLSEVVDYISACDAEIVPMPDHPWWRYQCFIKVLESLAMNKLLIVSDIPANRWIIGDAPVAFYLKGTSSREIARGIREFFEIRDKLDPSLGSQIVASRFSADKIAETLENQILASLGIRR